MKVGRREFLKLLGATAGAATIPKKIEGVEQAPVVAEKTYHPQWYTPSWLVDATHEVMEDLGEVAFQEADQSVETVPPEVYDCDYYFPVSEGVCFHEWVDPLTGVPRYTELSWGDHGLHTVYLADGQYLGQSLSKGIDPFEHVRSIWVAGLATVRMILRDRT